MLDLPPPSLRARYRSKIISDGVTLRLPHFLGHLDAMKEVARGLPIEVLQLPSCGPRNGAGTQLGLRQMANLIAGRETIR